MRVGMVVHAYYLKDARVRRYAEMLAAEGHQVDVFALREPGAAKNFKHLGVHIHGIGQTRLRGGRFSYLYEYLSSFLRFFARLSWLSLSGRHYDILHVHNMPDFLVFAALLEKLSGAKIILDMHDLMSEVYQSKYALPSNHWLPRLLRVEERWSTRFASAVITANHAFAEILIARGLSMTKVTVVMNAPDQKFFLSDTDRRAARRDKATDDFQIIYIGTMAPRYGVEIAVRAMAKLHRDGAIPGLRFSIIPKIANEGTYVDRIRAEINQSGLTRRFQMMDPVPNDKMPSIIAAADAMIYAPMPDVHMDIALSLKIPEAIAVGCPIVASRLSVNERYFGEEALFMFEPGNVAGCVAKVLEVFNDHAKVRAKVAKARAKLEEISWIKQSEQYHHLLARLNSTKSNRQATDT